MIRLLVSREFQSATENQALRDELLAQIEDHGGISFRDFMQTALHHPTLGYYSSPAEKLGPRGDYMTSPELSSIFATLVGRQIREMWAALDKPPTFHIVECGAGTGALCRDLLWWASTSEPDFFAAIQYTIVDVSDAMIARQRSLVEHGPYATRVDWADHMPGGIVGCILTNELLDSFAVHRVRMQDNVLSEVFVRFSDDAFVEELRPAPEDIKSYFNRLELLPGEGCTAEVNLQALDWMRDAGRALETGFVFTFDYGYQALELYAPWRTDGTLLCFYGHNPSSDPYARIGRQDITTHLDFTSLVTAGEKAGLTTIGITTQSEFLERLGIADALAPPSEGTDLESYYARRGQINQLLDPAGLGRIKVLVQSKDAPDTPLTGFKGA